MAIFASISASRRFWHAKHEKQLFKQGIAYSALGAGFGGALGGTLFAMVVFERPRKTVFNFLLSASVFAVLAGGLEYFEIWQQFSKRSKHVEATMSDTHTEAQHWKQEQYQRDVQLWKKFDEKIKI